MDTENKKVSILNSVLAILCKNSTKKEKKELERYDKIEFVDANKEIREKERNSQKTPS